MNFDFSEDARALQEQARRVFDETAGPDAARAIMDDKDRHYDEAIWRQAVAGVLLSACWNRRVLPSCAACWFPLNTEQEVAS